MNVYLILFLSLFVLRYFIVFFVGAKGLERPRVGNAYWVINLVPSRP